MPNGLNTKKLISLYLAKEIEVLPNILQNYRVYKLVMETSLGVITIINAFRDLN